MDLEERSTDTLHLERRRGLRVAQHRSVQVYEPATSRIFGGSTRNVSSTGLQLELPAHISISPGRLININISQRMTMSTFVQQRSLRPARVVWVRDAEFSEDGMVTAGIEFLDHVTNFAGAA